MQSLSAPTGGHQGLGQSDDADVLEVANALAEGLVEIQGGDVLALDLVEAIYNDGKVDMAIVERLEPRLQCDPERALELGGGVMLVKSLIAVHWTMSNTPP